MKKLHSGKLARTRQARPSSGAKLPRGRPFTKGNQFGRRTQFAKGVSPNPGGRTKWKLVTDFLRKRLSEDLPWNRSRTIAAEIGEILVQQALSGELEAIREVLDRVEGKPRQAIDVGQPDPLMNLLDELREQSAKLGPPPQDDEGAEMLQ